MAYIDGPDVGMRLARASITPRDAVRWAAQVASALAHAHAQGIVHRDVKPGNVLVDARGNAFLTDFRRRPLRGRPRGGRSRIGTPGFMAPEQASGGQVTFAADQYALGRTLLDMLMGKHMPLADAALTTEAPAGHPSAASRGGSPSDRSGAGGAVAVDGRVRGSARDGSEGGEGVDALRIS